MWNSVFSAGYGALIVMLFIIVKGYFRWNIPRLVDFPSPLNKKKRTEHVLQCRCLVYPVRETWRYAMQLHSISITHRALTHKIYQTLHRTKCGVMLWCIYVAIGSPIANMSKFATNLAIFSELSLVGQAFYFKPNFAILLRKVLRSIPKRLAACVLLPSVFSKASIIRWRSAL